MSGRKSPAKSATLYKIGTKKIGNDGNTWIIVENKNNIKKWQLYRKIQKPIINDTKKNNNDTKKSSKNMNNTKKNNNNTKKKSSKNNNDTKKKNSKNMNNTKKKSSRIITNNDTKYNVKISLDKLYDDIYDKPKIKENNWNKWLENCNIDLINFINKIRNSYKYFNKLKIKVVEVIEPPSFRSYWIDQYPHDFAKKNYPQYYEDKNNIVPHIIIRYKIDNDEHLATDYYQKCIEASILNITEKIKNKLINYFDINFPKQYYIKNNFENDYTLWVCLKDLNEKIKE